MQKLAILCIGVLAVGTAVFVATKPTAPQDEQIQDPPYWEGRIAAIGAKQAYQELASVLEDKKPNFTHRAAHSFGDALYASAGLEGFVVCDGQFSYGCSHELIARTITERGLGVVRDVARLCTEDVQCNHGLGHGLLSYLGYGESDLQEAVKHCTDTPTADLFSGCLGGVFMEYGLRSMVENRVPRVVALDGSRYEPCDSYAGVVAETCYYWQAEVWKHSWKEKLSGDAIAKTMGESCAVLTPRNRRSCMAGVGAAATSLTAHVPEKLAQFCDTAGASASDQILCRGSAGKALAGSVSPQAGEDVCKNTSMDIQTACLRYLGMPTSPADFKI